MMSKQEVLIAGGGIGGLTAALSFCRFGYPVQVLEQADAFEDVGAGIQLSPNCTRVLHDLGLKQELAAIGFEPRGVEFRHWESGALITAKDFGTFRQKYGFPYYHVHRADLIDVLASAARAEPDIKLSVNVKVSGINQDIDGVTVVAGDKEYYGALLTGADGIRSVVKSALFGSDPDDSHSSFSGNIAWRGLVPASRLPADFIRPMATIWWGQGKHFVHYHVRQGELVNCVGVVEKNGWETESWTARGDHSELKNDFAGWHNTVTTLIDHLDRDQCFKWALFDRSPMPAWGRGRVTLLGDACHPMLPFNAQGAAMAIEDAAVLSRCVAAGSDIAESISQYHELRRDRTDSVQRSSRRNARIFHATGIKAWGRDRFAGLFADRMFNDLFSYDATRMPEQEAK